MRRILLRCVLLLWAGALAAQESAEFTDPKALLDAVAKPYAQSQDSFHIEVIEESHDKRSR
jgi:hypothetical protein